MRFRFVIILAAASIALLGANCGGKQPPQNAHVLSGFGDSLTSHGKWFGFLPASWTAFDHGVAGQTCDQVVTRLEAEAGNLTGDSVVILCGSNDVRSGAYDIDATIARVVDGVAAAQAEGFAVTIGAPPPQFDANARNANAKLAELRDRLEAVAILNGAALADVWAAFWAFGDPLPLYSEDLIHPNAVGFEIVGTEIRAAVCCQ